MAGCDCGVWDFQVKPENYSSAYGYAQEAHWAAPSHGTCAAASLSRRHCSAEQLRPDARYAARHRVACGLRAERGASVMGLNQMEFGSWRVSALSKIDE
eukprot:g19108.t1